MRSVLRNWDILATSTTFTNLQGDLSPTNMLSILRNWREILVGETKCQDTTSLYSTVQLTLSDIKAFLHDGPITNSSQWYGQVANVTIICRGPLVRSFLKLPNKEMKRNSYLAVLPFQRNGAGIVAIDAELRYNLSSLLFAIDNGMFLDTPTTSPPHDQENPARDASIPCIFASARTYPSEGYGFSERKLRRIALHKFLLEIKKAFEMHNPPKDESTCRFVMDIIVFWQSGLYKIATVGTPSDNYQLVKVAVVWSKFKSYVSRIGKMDELMCDLLICSNNYVLSVMAGFQLNLLAVEENLTVSKNWAIDPTSLKSAIQQAYSDRSDGSDGSGSGSVRLEKSDIEEAVKYVIICSHNGMFSDDYPCKMIYDLRKPKVFRVSTFHLLKKRNGVYKLFNRKVKSVSRSGYRVRHISFWMWVGVIIGWVLPFAYLGIRWSETSFEERISTAVSLVVLYIAIASPIMFQYVYKGERLSDILSNIRHIDSQEEFDDRKQSRQLTDILEVIRMARRTPQFFGGRNMSYLGQWRVERYLLDAEETILFPNLERTGCGLYEDEKGEMYMLDKWSNLFEIILGIIGSYETGRNRSHVANIPDQNPYTTNPTRVDPETLKKMSIYCKPVKQKGYPKIVDARFSVNYEVSDGSKYQKTISRLLPYGSRKRKVGIRGWRLPASQEKWIEITNAEIFDMEIGRSFRDEVANF